MSNNTGYSLRPLAPLISHSDQQQNPEPKTQLPRKRNLACTSCQAKRTKCSGSAPCQQCTASKTECIFDLCKDKRRKLALRAALDDAQKSREILTDLIRTLRCGTDEDIRNLRESIQHTSSIQEAILYLELLHLTNED
ncbi:hypothetical protein BDV29DRAFT_171201 [Aspergillus leporis]|uniref:Zn(2)-C6 fungal-type domain-containing protein n=1 Tax=Aspergillus leporis TaxID=41062 RepID=A0A5N5X717_9EURO|nr:hypothetical protein BDV29DRAFT_171201 [Aspergillus leporis]